MNPAGRLTIDAFWDGRAITAVTIASSRPRAARMLVGKPVDEALRTVPLLFSLCGRAQSIAAQAAWRAAQGVAVDAAEMERDECQVAAEAAQEHLWRLLLDWPQLLGLPPQRERLAQWHRRIAAAQARGEWRALGAELLVMIERDIVAQPLPAWEDHLTQEAAATRGSVGDGLCGGLFEPLQRAEWKSPAVSPAPAFLPSLGTAALVREAELLSDEHFASAPQWQGAAAETGVLARHYTIPSVGALLASGRRLAARLLARVVDLVECAQRLVQPEGKPFAPLVAACNIGAGKGIARVETARGQLLHCIQAAAGRVESYVIVAPTEWNFHPQGAFRREALGARAAVAASMQRYLDGLALALDPCVEYEVNLHHA